MEDKDLNQDEQHVLSISNREAVTVNGVLEMISFDDQEIILNTDLGTLTLKGEELHIKTLNLDLGTLEVEGLVNGVNYGPKKAAKGKGKGIIDRLLR
ncbi:MAG TPA: sporulation protein YabP [Bacillota bacterium]|jgi:sporulation protein YabP